MNEYAKNGTKSCVVYERPLKLFDATAIASLACHYFFVVAFTLCIVTLFQKPNLEAFIKVQ